MGILRDSFNRWMNSVAFDNKVLSATDEELKNIYEEERQKWIKNGSTDRRFVKSLEMEKIDNEKRRRAEEKRKKDPNYNPNGKLPQHKNGWYLEDDD